ncbi:MAG: hypothetical protein FJY92_04175, partial [Candidatus Hydrogenedentes bacterium]|nr:hypothetical protein [Candidatus Hydrogenedentota bacterium]
MLLTASLLLAAVFAAPPQAVEFNGSFETPEARPEGWDKKTYGGGGAFTYDQQGRNGSRCVGIASATGGDLSWFARVPVKAYSRYRLSAYIKTENVEPAGGKGALINLHDGPEGASNAMTGT